MKKTDKNLLTLPFQLIFSIFFTYLDVNGTWKNKIKITSLLNSFNRREIRSKYSLLSSASQNLWMNERKSPKLITSKSGGKLGENP